MSNYRFIPPADVAGEEKLVSWWDNGFSQDEIQKLSEQGNSLIKKYGIDATIGDGRIDSTWRKAKVAWIQNDEESGWLYDKLSFVLNQVNGQYYQYDMYGFVEDFQYTVYQASEGDTEGDHYDWHIDKGYVRGASPRKLSMVVNLSDPSEYEGGELQFHANNGIETADKTQGKIHVFPSFLLHRVTPVTRGTRKSLVVWACGPKFR